MNVVKRFVLGVVALVLVAAVGGCGKHPAPVEGEGVVDGDTFLPIGTWRVVSGDIYGWDTDTLEEYAAQTGGPPSLTFASGGDVFANLPNTAESGGWAVQDGKLLLTFAGYQTSFVVTEDGDDLILASTDGGMTLTPYRSEDFIPVEQSGGSQDEDTDTTSGAQSGGVVPAAPIPSVVREGMKFGRAQYGQTYQWDDGILVTLQVPSTFEGVSDYVTVTVPIEIVNDSDSVFPLSEMWVEVITGGEEAELIGSIASSVGQETVAAGETVSGELSVSVALPAYALVVGLGDPDSQPVVYR